eukprot:GHVQ01010379.1.p1 GENE.GHVQ01010379.1~~GHVQ01010379.1.p1  ORF type:complete len:187 (+),score=19.30 GHVQ01010379.1:372-932(+)
MVHTATGVAVCTMRGQLRSWLAVSLLLSVLLVGAAWSTSALVTASRLDDVANEADRATSFPSLATKKPVAIRQANHMHTNTDDGQHEDILAVLGAVKHIRWIWNFIWEEELLRQLLIVLCFRFGQKIFSKPSALSPITRFIVYLYYSFRFRLYNGPDTLLREVVRSFLNNLFVFYMFDLIFICIVS